MLAFLLAFTVTWTAGMAYLKAYEAAEDRFYCDAATEAAESILTGDSIRMTRAAESVKWLWCAVHTLRLQVL